MRTLTPPNAENAPDPGQPLFAHGQSAHPTWLWWLLIGLIFAVGLGVRLYRLADPPVDFHPTRQLHSALIARGMYYERQANAPDWQRSMAVGQWHAEGIIEPQLFERLAAWSYSVVGSADLSIPRLVAIIFWMAAAVFLVVLSVELVGWGGALLAGLFFLVWPYGVIASRAFQPEPIMIALMVAALWAALRWSERKSWGWAIAAGLLAGLAIYIKSVAVFFLGPALAALVLVCFGQERGGLCRMLRSPQIWVLAALAIVPYGLYLLDGVVVQKYLVSQFSQRFFPEMWQDPAFYLRWISNLGRAIPFEMALAALLGAFLIRRPAGRALVLGMWVGYFLYGMTLSHHIGTHDYYHLPLYPAVALGLAALSQVIFDHLRGPAWLARLAVVSVLIAALVIDGYAARTQIKRSGAVEQAQAWSAIGEVIGPGASVVALVPDYGAGLEYYGWNTPIIWPTVDEMRFLGEGDNPDFNNLYDERAAGRDYFVVTLFDELDRQPALKETLAKNYTLYREGPGYRIYALRK